MCVCACVEDGYMCVHVEKREGMCDGCVCVCMSGEEEVHV